MVGGLHSMELQINSKHRLPILIATIIGFLTTLSAAQSLPDTSREKTVASDIAPPSTPIVKDAPALETAMHSGAMNVDLNYPGVGVRYFFSDKMALEGRLQDDGGNLAVGPRLYFYYPALFPARSRFSPYLCVESDYVAYKGSSTKGNGYAVGIFAGVEYSLSNSFSMQIDTGGLYLALKDKTDSGFAYENDLGFTINFGVNYYFKSGNSQLPEVP